MIIQKVPGLPRRRVLGAGALYAGGLPIMDNKQRCRRWIGQSQPSRQR